MQNAHNTTARNTILSAENPRVGEYNTNAPAIAEAYANAQAAYKTARNTQQADPEWDVAMAFAQGELDGLWDALSAEHKPAIEQQARFLQQRLDNMWLAAQ